MKPTLLSLLTGSLLLSAAMAGETGPSTGAVAKDVPYGHEDFVPTPERPVYFRQTSGDYPGATPPLEWWEGTPTTRKVGKAEVADFADQKSKNIFWKAPVPGWGLSHPIVVGKRVFAVGELDFVTCWDLDTGKQLWQRRIMPLLCDGLPEEKAAAGQKVLDLARAFWIIAGGYCNQPGNLFKGWNGVGTPANPDHAAFVAEKKAMAQKLLHAFTPHRPEVEAFGNAALLAALDKDLEILRRYQAVTDLEALKSLLGTGPGLRPLNLVKACVAVLQVDLSITWMGYVSSADSTLASDGQRIYGVFDQGQVFALDLDGNLLWLKREKGKHDNRGTFHRSPLLCGDLLLVRSIHALPRRTTGVPANGGVIFPLRALDVKTGEVRWEVPLAGSNYTVPRLTRLPGPDGRPVDVLLGDAQEGEDQGQAVVRVTDGKLLGYLPPNRVERGAVMAVFGQQVTWTACLGPTCSYRLRLGGPDTVVAEEVFVSEKFAYGQKEFPTVAGTTWMCAGDSRGSLLRDGTTGALISKVPVASSFGVVAGHYLITLSGGKNEDGFPSGTATRSDGASGMFSVIDIKDPAQPVVMARNNLLGYKEPAADPIVSTYFKNFDPFDFAGVDRGAARYFMKMGGPVPAGDKVLIQSTKYLYCIGPAIQGVPGDNPAAVQAIRAAKPAELATYLASPSALYRHTAVTAMIAARIGAAKQAVTRLVKEDPYEEIRAAAVLALNAAEPEAAPGTQALLPLMTAAWIGGGDDMRFERRALQRTLEVLGKERGTALLVAAFTKTQDEPTRQSLIDFAAVMGWAAPEFTRQVQIYLAPRNPNHVLAARYLVRSGLITTDKEVREAVKGAYRQLGPWQSVLSMLAVPLGQVLDGEEKIAFLLHGLRLFSGGNDPVGRVPFLRQLQAMGRDAGSAIPELEKMVAARENLADEFAPVIAALKGQ